MMRLVLVGAVMLGAGAAQAQRVSRVDGSRLLSMCMSSAKAECDAYLSGVADAIGVQGREHAAACIPTAVSGTQLREVVTKYISSNPQSRQQKAADLTLKAFAAAFPCRP